MRNKATKKNMDLDLRRYGNKLYSKAEGSGGSDGGGGNSDIFFVPATIQPKYFVNNPNGEPIEIKNYTPSMVAVFLYNKEDIISLGVNEEDLNNLEYIGLLDAYTDVDSNHAKGCLIQQSAFDNKIILLNITNREVYTCGIKGNCYVYKIADDMFLILEPSGGMN